ncbi:hypothetical protein PLANTIT3_30223 [Plantibacter sp. T3]|nr:hypothetical protein PLANTIT3_30223 [Plantibacter sp. T3]
MSSTRSSYRPGWPSGSILRTRPAATKALSTLYTACGEVCGARGFKDATTCSTSACGVRARISRTARRPVVTRSPAARIFVLKSNAADSTPDPFMQPPYRVVLN